MWSLHGIWEKIFKQMHNGPGHMTNVAAVLINDKNFKNLLLWDQKADNFESWYAAMGTWVLPSLFKWSPWVDLDLFLAMSYFCMEKKLKQWIVQKLLYSMVSKLLDSVN